MPSRAHHRQRRGTVLIVAMWIVLVLAGLTLVFARNSRVEALASANHVASLQAGAVARAGLQYVVVHLDGNDGHTQALDDLAWEAVQVGDGYFWIVRPDHENDRSWSYGLVDEGSKINLNTARTEVLAKLPGMTAETAASIVDWRDRDSTVSPGGGEDEYYLLQSPAYYCKNGPFETVGELGLVKGISRDILFGEDRNRNGVLDANENDAGETDPPDNSDGTLDRGLVDYATVYSVEPNTNLDGRPRVNVNRGNTQELTNALRDAVAGDRLAQVVQSARQGRPFRNLVDFYLRTGLRPEEFAKAADRLTTTQDENLVGLINVVTAPRAMLVCLPGLEDEKDVEALLAKRAEEDTDLSSIAWVADTLLSEKAVKLGDVITARSFQFSADIVATNGDGRAFKRYRAVIDARTSPPRVVCWQELTHLGWPLAPEIIESLRAGKIPDVVTIAGKTRGR